MICIYTPSLEAAPPLSSPVPAEYNPHNLPRPVTLKIRKVRGKTGWLIRRYGHFLGRPKNDPVGSGHHALQIGEYLYEMTREKSIVGQRLEGPLIWGSTVGEMCVGWTDLKDEEVRTEALEAQECVRGRNGGKYHLLRNNCQHFIQELQRRLVNLEDGGYELGKPDVSSETCRVVACTTSTTMITTESDSIDASPPPSRHDSAAEKALPEVKVRASTFGPLAAVVMVPYSREEDVKNGVGGTEVVATKVTAVSCE